MKFDGGRMTKEPSEFLSMAGIEHSELMSMAESVLASSAPGTNFTLLINSFMGIL